MGMSMTMVGKMVMVGLVVAMVIGNEAVGSMGMSLCNITEEGLEACKPSVSGTNPAKPSVACCQALSKADMPCLCSYKNSFMLPSLGIDPDLAMQLPEQCNLQKPQC